MSVIGRFAKRAMRKMANRIVQGLDETPDSHFGVRRAPFAGAAVAVGVGLFFIMMVVIIVTRMPLILLDGFFDAHTADGVTLDTAGSVLGVLDGTEDVLDGSNSVFFDDETVRRILKVIDERNAALTSEKEISYEYKVSEGHVLTYDPVTGDCTLGPIEVKKKVQQPVEKTIFIKVPLTAGDIKAMYTDKGLEPPPRDVISSMYKEIEVTEQVLEEVEVTEVLEPGEAFYTDTKKLDRSSVDKGTYILDDIFTVRWQTIVTLCAMYIQYNIGQDLSALPDEDAGIKYRLTDADIEKIVDIVAYNYYFYDDPTLDDATDFSFDCIQKRVTAYRLETDPDPAVVLNCVYGSGVPLTQIAVRRVPSIAPRMIKNSFLTYIYTYDTLDNGYMKLTGRKCKIEPQGFIDACVRIIPDFEFDDFLEMLALLEGTEDQIAYYKSVMEGGEISTETSSVGECPLIGTYVSKPKGLFRYAKLHTKSGVIVTERELNDEEVSITVQETAGNGSHAYTGKLVLNEADLEDPWFLRMVSFAEPCLGTPYKMGAYTPGEKMDCSGFVCYVLRNMGYEVGAGHGMTSRQLYRFCSPLYPVNNEVSGYLTEADAREGKRTYRFSDVSGLLPGDLIFFKNTNLRSASNPGGLEEGVISHVGIYLGNGTMIHSGNPNKQSTLSESKMWSSDYYFYGFGRLPDR